MSPSLQSGPPVPSVSTPVEGQTPPEKLVRDALDRVCLSVEFARSRRMVALLRFLIDALLHRDFDLLNERAIGVAIFEQHSNWDPSLNTIVRSEARRLRSKLDIYYTTAGVHDAVRISIPKGAYVPQLKWLPSTPSPLSRSAAPWPVEPQTNSKPWHRRPFVWLTVIACTALLALLTVRALREDAKTSYDVRAFTTELGEEFSPAISPDGQTIAYVAHAPGIASSRILLKRFGEKEPQPLTPKEGIYQFPSWSPDGSRLAYDRVDSDHVTVFVRSLKEGSELAVTAITRQGGKWSGQPGALLGNPGPAWSSDGRRLIVTDTDPQGSGLFLVDLAGHRTRLTTSSGESRDFTPRTSPDGKRVAFVRYFSHGSADIYTVPIAGGPVTRITQQQQEVEGITWQTDSRTLIASINRDGVLALWRIPLQGTPSRLTINATSPAEPSISLADGTIAFVESSQNWNLWRYPIQDTALGKPTLLLSSSGRNYDARYSPDGNRIAFASDRSGTMQLWLADADGTHLKQQTHLAGAWVGGIAWSPDGSTLAFDARPEGHSTIFLLNIATGVIDPIDHDRFEERMPSFSSDGRSLYLNSTRGGGVEIWRFDLISRTFVRLPPSRISNVFSATESADGTRLVYGTRDGQLWSGPPNGDTPRLLSNISVAPSLSWTVAANRLYFTGRDGEGTFTLCHTADDKPHCLNNIEGLLVNYIPGIAISPDGHWALIARQDNASGDIKIARPSNP